MGNPSPFFAIVERLVLKAKITDTYHLLCLSESHPDIKDFVELVVDKVVALLAPKQFS